MSHDKIVKRATNEEVCNMSLFSKDLISSAENIELFDEELFLFGECNMGVMPIKNKQTIISAQTFHRYSSIDPCDVQNLCSFIEECLLNIELLEIGSARQTSFVEILINFQEIANCIFFMDEFIDISIVLGQLAVTLDKYHVNDLEEFVIETLRGITTDLHRWITDVFITKASTNIHELEPSIIGSSKQLIFMLKKE